MDLSVSGSLRLDVAGEAPPPQQDSAARARPKWISAFRPGNRKPLLRALKRAGLIALLPAQRLPSFRSVTTAAAEDCADHRPASSATNPRTLPDSELPRAPLEAASCRRRRRRLRASSSSPWVSTCQSPLRTMLANRPGGLRWPTASACSAAAWNRRRSASHACTRPTEAARANSRASRLSSRRSAGVTCPRPSRLRFCVRLRTPSGRPKPGAWFP